MLLNWEVIWQASDSSLSHDILDMAIKTISFRAWFAGNDDDDDGDEVTGEGVEEVACGACIAIKKFADDEEKEAVEADEADDIYIGDIE